MLVLSRNVVIVVSDPHHIAHRTHTISRIVCLTTRSVVAVLMLFFGVAPLLSRQNHRGGIPGFGDGSRQQGAEPFPRAVGAGGGVFEGGTSVWPCLVLFCLVLPCLALPCLVFPCRALSCHDFACACTRRTKTSTDTYPGSFCASGDAVTHLHQPVTVLQPRCAPLMLV